MTRGLYEILDMAADEKKVPDKAAVLRKYADVYLGALFRLIFDPAVQWAELPETTIYHPADFPDMENNFRGELKTIHRFFKGGALDVYGPQHQRYQRQETNRLSQWIQLLERIHPKDAELLLAAKDRKLPKFRGLMNKAIILEAFPELAYFNAEAEKEPA